MKKPLVLIVEDDLQIGRLFTKVLEADFDTEVANDGSTALLRLTQIIPTIVILDLNLPDMGGGEILENIRKDARFQNTSIILCTADDRQASMLQEKVDIILLKPVSPLQLRAIALRLASH